MIYVSAIAKWALERDEQGAIPMPGKLEDFFYETSDEHFFDGYTHSQSVFYPIDGGKFFYTHEAYKKWLNETGNKAYPDETNIKPVQFMPILADGCEEYSIEWISKHFRDFHANWETLTYKYSPIDKRAIRVNWGINEAITDYINTRQEIIDMRNSIAVLMDFVNGKLSDEEKTELASKWEKQGEVEKIEAYDQQEKRIRNIIKAIEKRHAQEE